MLILYQLGNLKYNIVVVKGVLMKFIIEYWVQIFFGALIAFITYLYRKIEQEKNLLVATKRGVQVLLKAKIIESYHVFQNQGCIYISQKEAFHDLYEEYRKLSDNSVIKELVTEIDELPLKEEGRN